MATALLALHYLPNVAWFKNYFLHDTILLERHENFVKSTGRNRCEIAGPQGRQTLTIPLAGGRDHHQLYTDTRIAYATNWNYSHWHSIKSAYGSAPYFEFYAHIFEKFYEKQHLLLFDFNLELLNMVLSILKAKKPYELTETYHKSSDTVIDLRSLKNSSNDQPLPRYLQVFEERNGFISNLSILDLIFNLGPQAIHYLAR